jgi:glycosyltransferase involved in cell wall biosynthesis
MKKKVLLIHHSGLIGGAGVSFYNLWLTLQNRFEVVGYVPDEPPDFMNDLRAKGLRPRFFRFRLGKITYYSGGNRLLNLKFWYHFLHILFQYKYWKNVISNEKPDLVIVNSKVLCWMGILFKRAGIKSICFVRETILGNPKNLVNRFIRSLLENFQLVTFLSNYDKQQTALSNTISIVATDYLDPCKYKNVIDKKVACSRLGINPNTFNVLYVGGINELKGIDIAIKALSLLDNQVSLIVAGADSGLVKEKGLRGLILKVKKGKIINFSKSIKKRIKENNLEKNVFIIGVQTEMVTAYSACDLLIFPMKKPHQARPAFEVGVQKKPVVISDFPNIREFVVNGENGVTFEPNNPNSLSKVIQDLMNNPELLKQYGNRNYEYTMKYHTEGYAIKELINKIEELVKI